MSIFGGSVELLRSVMGFDEPEVTPEPEPEPVKPVPPKTLDTAVSLLKRCVQETHFSPLYYGDPELYREIWNFIVR